MGSEMATKIRLVRCPKCSKVLPELPDFDVYKCGGCNATLQAKRRVNIAKSTEPGQHDAISVPGNHTEHVPEEKECSLGDKDVLPCLDDSSSFQNHDSDHSQSGDCDGEQPQGINLSSENQDDGSRPSTSTDCDNEGSEVTNEVYSPTDFVDDKSAEFYPSGDSERANSGTSFANRELERNGNEELAVSDKESADDENKGCDDHVSEQCELEELARHGENEDSSREFLDEENETLSRKWSQNYVSACTSFTNSKFEHEENYMLAQTENKGRDGHVNDQFVHNKDEDFSRELEYAQKKEFSLKKNAEAEVKQDLLKSPEQDLEFSRKKNCNDPKVGTINAVRSVPTKASDLVPAKESDHHVYGRLSSEEFNPSSELSDPFGDSSKFPIRNSHAYDASVSSSEGMDDQLPSFLHSEEQPRREKLMEPTLMNGDSDMQHQEKPIPSEKSHANRTDNWDRDEFRDPTDRIWRQERHAQQPISDFHRALPQKSYEKSGSSNSLHEDFQRRLSFQSEWSEEQMITLLKMALELQNQRDNSYPPYNKDDRISGVAQKSRYEFDPRYHNYDATREGHFRHQSNDARSWGRYDSGSNYADYHRPKKIPFSGEAIARSHPLNPSCSHCFPQDWSRSAQLPGPSRYDPVGPCRVHLGHRYCDCHRSVPPSPQYSEYNQWGHDTQSDSHHRRSHELTNYLARERHRPAKRHFRPVARGAPFIACYKCQVVMQIPADFLLFKKKCHLLKCGACSAVLEFSLKKGSHVVRYSAEAVIHPPPPPPTEAVEKANEASTSQMPVEDPVSHSNNRDLDRGKNCSSEVESVPDTPIQTPLGKAFDRILFGSYDPSGDSKELAPEPSPTRYSNRPPRYESPRPSSSMSKSKKPSSEIEDERQRSTSPLHRLMGYSSPSQVIRPYGREMSSSSYSMQRGK